MKRGIVIRWFSDHCANVFRVADKDIDRMLDLWRISKIRSLKDFRKNEIWFDERFAPVTALEVTGNIVVRTRQE